MMKKHIRKKYLFQHKLDLPDGSPLLYLVTKPDQEALKKNHKKSNLLIQNFDNDIYFGFIYNNSGTYVPIALPDFTLVYFDFAYNLNINRKKIQQELLSKLSHTETMSEDRSKELYNFYGIATSCVINLFTSIESFVNHLLPHDKKYTSEKVNRTEIYDREQIQLHITFMEKLKKVLPQFYNRSFFVKPSPATQYIENLKDLRDKLIHTKSDSTFETHIETFKKLLNFHYDETLDAVAKFINFYKEGYIEPCPCNQDF